MVKSRFSRGIIPTWPIPRGPCSRTVPFPACCLLECRAPRSHRLAMWQKSRSETPCPPIDRTCRRYVSMDETVSAPNRQVFATRDSPSPERDEVRFTQRKIGIPPGPLEHLGASIQVVPGNLVKPSTSMYAMAISQRSPDQETRGTYDSPLPV